MAHSFCRRILLFLCACSVSATVLPAASAQDDCAKAAETEQAQCLAQKIDGANQELQSVYTAALAKMPDHDPTDGRRNKSQLVRSQTAWLAFVEANCAYVEGAEGGSKGVTSFAGRCRLKEIRARTDFLRQQAKLPNDNGATRPPATAASVQQVLDKVGTPVAPSTSIAGLPDSYSAWSEQQRYTVPGQMRSRCVTEFATMNEIGPVKLLPPAQDAADAPRLVLDLCLAAHMPIDWPNRASTLSDAQRILDRSTALGELLRIPTALENAPTKRN